MTNEDKNTLTIRTRNNKEILERYYDQLDQSQIDHIKKFITKNNEGEKISFVAIYLSREVEGVGRLKRKEVECIGLEQAMKELLEFLGMKNK